MFQVFEHTADVGLRIRAATLEELLADAARGLFSLLVANLDQIRCVEEAHFEVSGTEPEYLLVDWLNELLYAFATRGRLYGRFTVRLTTAGLQATAWGEPVDRARHSLEHEVKAITYHGLQCRQTTEGWSAEIILDI